MKQYNICITTTYTVDAEDEDSAVDIAMEYLKDDLNGERIKDIFGCMAEVLDSI